MKAHTTIPALLAAALLLSNSSIAEAQRPQRRDIELLVGEQTSIPAEGVASYSEGAPGIVDVRVPADGSQFVIVALQPGNTTLLLIQENGQQIQYRITVRDQDEEPTGIQQRDNIRLDFYFVQLADSYSHQIGLGWPGVIGGGDTMSLNASYNLLGPNFNNANINVTGLPLPRLDLLESSGWARIMRHAALITANGNEATFFGGEEVNIVVADGLSRTVEGIQFGAQIRVIPRYDRGTGRIELQVETEMSELTEGRGTGLPGRVLSNLSTLVNLEMGQAVVLAGLVSEVRNASSTGLPGLSQIPILGIFFGSHNERREYTQNALFIVPTVVDIVSQQARTRIANALNLYWDYSGGLDDIELTPMVAGSPSPAHPDSRDGAALQVQESAPASGGGGGGGESPWPPPAEGDGGE